MTTLSTTRTILREVTIEDAPFILALLNDPAWLKYIGDRGVKTLDDARRHIEKNYVPPYQKLGFGMYLVTRKVDHTPIGMCGLIKREHLDDVDIGFAFLSDFRGQGYAYEAAQVVMNHATVTLGMKRLVAIVVPYHADSIKLLKKLGFIFEKTIRLPNDPEELQLFGWKYQS